MNSSCWYFRLNLDPRNINEKLIPFTHGIRSYLGSRGYFNKLFQLFLKQPLSTLWKMPVFSTYGQLAHIFYRQNIPRNLRYLFYRLNVNVPLPFTYSVRTPHVMVLRGGALESWLGHEDGGLRKEISAPIKRSQRVPLLEDTVKSSSSMNQEVDTP